jgi:outer membrane protein OmpA-like peptidoglycan-associated protein/Tol biopolymer transport system component
MKHILFVIIASLFTACGIAQQSYSTSSKKAIRYFEEGQQAPSASIDKRTGQPNYLKGIELLEKAIEKDPRFWEAHMVVGEFYEKLGDNRNAIQHFQKALAINPNHSPSGSTYFFLANLQQLVGDYDDAIRNFNLFLDNHNANPKMTSMAYELKQNCLFAKESMRNPLDFNPINIGPGINTADPEYFPTITVDGKTILFTRRIKDERVPVYKEQEDFFVSHLSDKNIWMSATPMPNNVNTAFNEGAPTIAADGRSLIFVACSGQSSDNDYGQGRTGKGSCDLFITKKLGSRWANPINLPGYVNTFTWESQPSLSSDGKTLYFIRRVSKRGEPANSDIYVTRLQDNGTWGMPEPLPNYINTSNQEESVLIHPDGKTLYFASRGHIGMGGSDLYITRMDEKGNWGKPENLGYPINTKYDENSLMVSPDGEIGFFASDREGGFGKLDIYYFVMPENLRPTKTLYFDGIVYDAITHKPLPGKFQLIDLKTGNEIVYSEADDLTGEFMVSLPVNNDYALNVTYPGYNFFSKNFNMTSSEGLEAIHMEVPMVPMTSDRPTVLANVFFDLGKAILRPESFVELNKLKDLLNDHPTIQIEIGGHTDTRGDATENKMLSNNRAKAVYEYLVTHGIDSKRMSFKGYGETKTVVSDETIEKLSTDQEKEAAHQSNRRTEYKIVK